MEESRIIRSSAFYQNRYNEGVRDELVSDMDGAYGSDCGIMTNYTEIDEMLDKQDRKEQEPELPISDYSPVHSYRWALEKAMECEHLICNEIVPKKMRLVYAEGKPTLRRYDKNGITTMMFDPTGEAINSKTWRLWNGEY